MLKIQYLDLKLAIAEQFLALAKRAIYTARQFHSEAMPIKQNSQFGLHT